MATSLELADPVEYASWSEGDGHSAPVLGLGVGYRWPIRSSASARVEAGYERALEGWDTFEGHDTFGASVGLAIRF